MITNNNLTEAAVCRIAIEYERELIEASTTSLNHFNIYKYGLVDDTQLALFNFYDEIYDDRCAYISQIVEQLMKLFEDDEDFTKVSDYTDIYLTYLSKEDVDKIISEYREAVTEDVER